MKIKSLFLSLALLAIAMSTYAQLNEGGIPYSFDNRGLTDKISTIELPKVDVAKLLAEDEANTGKMGPYRFGKEIPVFVTLENSGTWETLKDGSRLWRQAIYTEGAYSINLIFENFHLPEGAKLFIYNRDKSMVQGAFTSKNNKPHEYFATDLISGDYITLEYLEPKNVTGEGRFTLTTVVHAYKDVISNTHLSKAGGGSGPCNINVSCPLGNNWTDEINSVTRITLGGGLCSGALVNNTSNDGTPYYLTANHCYQGSNPATWVFRFNYQSSTCGGSNGPTNQSLTGSIFRANNANSDFALVELEDAIPESYNPFLAGWRNNNTASSSSVGIHHPSGDIKKISRDQNSTSSATWGGATTWRIGAWEEGTTEGGSSGSPLFDEATHQIIGQLYGGTAACSGSNPNNESDFYGKFSVSWDGSSSSNRLRDWLDPGNTGATSVNGIDPFAPQFALDAGVASIASPNNGDNLCNDVVSPVASIKNFGSTTLNSLTIVLDIDGNQQTINWTGALATNETELINFNDMVLSAGNHTMTVTTSSPNGNSDQNNPNNTSQITFTTVVGTTVTLTLRTDGYGGETGWELKDANDSVIYSEPINTYSSNTTYDIELCLEDNACYTFTIYDSYGDGICCSQGQGYYTLEDENGILMAEGGQFEDSETTNFCLPLPVELPYATFSTNVGDSICRNTQITYTNLDTNSYPTTYSWSFEGGSPATSSNPNPTITYNTPGNYDVMLIAVNAFGEDTTELADYVTVLQKPNLNLSSTVEHGGNNDGTATVNISSGTPPYDITWSSGQQDTETITGLSSGNYQVTVTDANGCETTGQVSVGTNVGIDDNELASLIVLYPNPSSGKINITLPANMVTNELLVHDLVGELVYTLNKPNANQLSLDVSSLSDGIYYVTLMINNQAITKKLVLTK